MLLYAWPASIFLVMLLVLLAARCVTWRGCFPFKERAAPAPVSVQHLPQQKWCSFPFLKPVSICKASVAFKLQVCFDEPSLLSFFWNSLHSIQTGIIYQYKHFNDSSCFMHPMYCTQQCEWILTFEAENVVKFNHSKPNHQCLWWTLMDFSKE